MHSPTGRVIKKRRVGALAVTIALGLGVAACGGGDDGTSAASGGGDKAEGGSLKVGVLVPLTGELGSWGEDWSRSYQLAAKEIDATGLLPGGKIQLVVDDEGSSAASAVRAAQKMIDVDGVDVILGASSSSIVALNQIVSTNEVPVISPAAGTTQMDSVGGEWLWRTYPSDSDEGVADAAFFAAQGINRISIMAQNEESAQSVAGVLEKKFSDNGGTIAKKVAFDPGQPSYQAEIRNALDGDPQLVYVAAGEESATTLLREIRQAGFKGKLAVNGDLASPATLKALGPDVMDGTYSALANTDDKLPEYQKFKSAFEAEFGKEIYVTLANAYDSLVVAALAAKAANSNTGAAIREHLVAVAGDGGQKVTSFAEGAKALEAGNDIDYEGASGKVDFDERGTSPSQFSIVQAGGAKWKTVKTFTADELAQ
jgi:ABC-type branched-subunit amino acid transport system substrate-binding protein